MTEDFTTEFDDDEDLDDDEASEDAEFEPRYAHVGEWVEQWFSHAVAGPYTRDGSAGGRTWCPFWWKHPSVATALGALHMAWEAARVSDDPAARSAWWVHHAYPHIRWLCDATAGPMYRCSPAEHVEDTKHSADENLAVIPAPTGWFEPFEKEDTDDE